MMQVQVNFITGMMVGFEWVELEDVNYIAIDLFIIRIIFGFE
jgi:hypothetical protein